ncbi:MAG TPA: NlpC/P60 family protein [Cyclobacteriaceae bacterium]|jgi:hypothetical protein|nr:NlpC/P60 family protein [Cyclobacteriaceae bacterium]
MMEPDYGVCRLSIVPVFDEAKAVSQKYQLLFGDSYEVVNRTKDKSWYLIRTEGVEGWIHRLHHHSISREYFDQISQADFKITLDLVSTMLYQKSRLPILMGSIVPISSAELFKMDEQFAFNGEAKSIAQKRDAEFVKSVAMKYVNAPEVPGGRSPFGISAQGLVSVVFRIAGYTLPWTMQLQSQFGKKIKDLASSKTADVAFFKDKKNNVVHTGIILGENKVIHAFGQVRIDHLNDEGILSSDTKIYSHELAFIRRILS